MLDLGQGERQGRVLVLGLVLVLEVLVSQPAQTQRRGSSAEGFLLVSVRGSRVLGSS